MHQRDRNGQVRVWARVRASPHPHPHPHPHPNPNPSPNPNPNPNQAADYGLSCTLDALAYGSGLDGKEKIEEKADGEKV